MKVTLSGFACFLSGLVGLALVFRDLPISPGPGLVALGGLFYLGVGFTLTKWHNGRRPLVWGLAPGWGLVLLGIVGVWTTITDPASGHWTLALVFLLGPGLTGLTGAVLARRGSSA